MQSHELCIERTAGDSQPDLRLTTPSGKVHRLVPIASSRGLWVWNLEATMGYGPLREVGQYRYEISSQVSSTETSEPTSSPEAAPTGRFAVGRATRPVAELRLIGRSVKLTVAGVEGGETIYPTLFGPHADVPDKEFPFYADLPAKSADEDGELIADLTLPTRTPRGTYLLWIEPVSVTECAGESCLKFDVGAG
ncbi:hypothetical protein AB0L64_39830 [Kribbella sp. NPDC051936]|uniref:hypothetical protein n=1 Tax=Kribbella sp. NPDC051936 TaxID=3154946 RepID=UPI00343047D7